MTQVGTGVAPLTREIPREVTAAGAPQVARLIAAAWPAGTARAPPLTVTQKPGPMWRDIGPADHRRLPASKDRDGSRVAP